MILVLTRLEHVIWRLWFTQIWNFGLVGPYRTSHFGYYEGALKELKALYGCINHWANVVNKAQSKLWPAAIEDVSSDDETANQQDSQ